MVAHMFDALGRAGLAALGPDGAHTLPLPLLMLRIQRLQRALVPACTTGAGWALIPLSPCMCSSRFTCPILCQAVSRQTSTSGGLLRPTADSTPDEQKQVHAMASTGYTATYNCESMCTFLLHLHGMLLHATSNKKMH